MIILRSIVYLDVYIFKVFLIFIVLFSILLSIFNLERVVLILLFIVCSINMCFYFRLVKFLLFMIKVMGGEILGIK